MSLESILITVSGPDRPGITSSLLQVIVKSGHPIIDMGQAVTHGLLSLSILLDMSVHPEKSDHPVIKDLLFEAKKLGLGLEFKIIDQDPEYTKEVDERFILNCVSVNDITAQFLLDCSQLMAENRINIISIDTVSPDRFKSLELTTTVPKDVDWKQIKKSLMEISRCHKVDVAFLKDNVFRRNKRLIVFDMDSTLIQTEVIDEMANVCGVGDTVAEITNEAMSGKIDFDESLKRRLSLLKGLDRNQLQQILEGLRLTKGAFEFIKTVKGLGYKVAIISGGFSFFAQALKEKLGLDYAFANELEFDESGKLTGQIKGTIVNASQKAMVLQMLAQQENIHLEQVVAIGDGANDIPMLATAGLGIAYHAKEIVKERAGHHMSHGPMTSILYFLGIPGEDSI